MAEEPQVLRGINWREAFPFTNLFRAFRIAIHPSKLVLALLALLALYLGGRLLDAAWHSKHRAVPALAADEAGEIEQYERTETADELTRWREAQRNAVGDRYARYLRETAEAKAAAEAAANVPADQRTWTKLLQDNNALTARARAGEDTQHVNYWIKTSVPQEAKKIQQDHEARIKQINEIKADTDEQKQNKQRQLEDAEKQRQDRLKQLYEEAASARRTVEGLEGQGPFEAFFNFQSARINDVVNGVLTWNWLGGFDGRTPPGVAASVYRFFTTAPTWALRHHSLYFFLFGALFLVIWSLFGGAIARIAAVHVADEGRKLSVRQGLSFAVSKFLSFLSAPLIPAIIILVLGVLLAVGGLLLNIPWLGEIVVGGLFFLALAAGFVMTLVLLGTAGGFNLMYPTIAVEGSDSFDAISRSFSYVYAKPWRMLFYSLLAIIYGALCYLFIRLFIWLLLVLTWWFVGLLVFRTADNGVNLWHVMFPGPQHLWKLPYDINYLALGPAGDIGAFLVAFWAYLTIAMLGAFAISFYFSANTIIYYLMRREVDATEMDDVYLEQPEEDFAETPATAAAAPAAAAESQPAESAAAAAAAEPTPATASGDTPPASTEPPRDTPAGT
jgi:hypothetical protein